VRVMTVHGAKGLEAPVVILADTTTVPAGPPHLSPRLLELPPQNAPPDTPDRLVWVPTKKEDVGPTAAARDKLVAEAEDEYRRLLYVALTRAADRLIVCGAVGERQMPKACWYELVGRGLEAGGKLMEEVADFDPKITVKRYKSLGPPEKTAAPASSPAAEMPPGWLRRAAPADKAPLPITPSMFHDEPVPVFASSGTGREKALARGNLVHRLMQSLPDQLPEWRESAGRRYLARNGKDFSTAEQEALLAKVLALLDDKRFAELFAPGSRAEVPIVGRIHGRPLSGQVDRLVVTPKAVLIGDYKTNNPPPRRPQDAPRGYILQLALYRAVLAKLYPDRPIRAALVWTETPEIMEIPGHALDAALTAEDLS